MSLTSVFDIAASSMTAQSMRLNVTASNLANAESAGGPGKAPYKAKQVVFAEMLMPDTGAAGVQVTQVAEDPTPPRKVYQPNHPMADAQGYVSMPNVNPVDEMANMISASRSYQSSVEMMNTAKQLLTKTLALGQ